MIPIPRDFKEFLLSLNSHGVRYLLIGGYAVNYHGYVRGTADMDVWIQIDPTNAQRIEQALRQFGFGVPELSSEMFLKPHTIVRMGVAPMRLEIVNTISGVEFDDCFERRVDSVIEGVPVPVIGLDDLKQHKRASGRDKDLVDLNRLP